MSREEILITSEVRIVLFRGFLEFSERANLLEMIRERSEFSSETSQGRQLEITTFPSLPLEMYLRSKIEFFSRGGPSLNRVVIRDAPLVTLSDGGGIYLFLSSANVSFSSYNISVNSGDLLSVLGSVVPNLTIQGSPSVLSLKFYQGISFSGVTSGQDPLARYRNLLLEELKELAYALQIPYDLPFTEPQRGNVLSHISYILNGTLPTPAQREQQVLSSRTKKCVNVTTPLIKKNVLLASDAQLTFLPEPPRPIDYSTYDVYYIDEAIDKLRLRILEYFQKNGSGTLGTIKASINPEGLNDNTFREKYIQIALSQMILDREPIIDRSGYVVFLKEDDGVYYMTRRFPLQSELYEDASLAYYAESLIVEEDNDLEDIVTDIEKEQMGIVSNELELIPSSSPNYIGILKGALEEYKIENQVHILEEAVQRWVQGQDNEYIRAIINIYSKVLFEIYEPLTEIAAASQLMSIGKKYEPTHAFIFEQGGNKVYIHALYHFASRRTRSGQTSRILKAEGKIRILKPVEDSNWRSTNDYESEVYRRFIENKRSYDIEHYRQFPIYGILEPNSSNPKKVDFKIAWPAKEQSGTKAGSRSAFKGRVCGPGWPFYDLVDVGWEFNIGYPNDVIRRTVPNDANLVYNSISSRLKKSPQEVQEMMGNPEKLLYYYLWSLTKKETRTTVCEKIRLQMDRAGKLYRMI